MSDDDCPASGILRDWHAECLTCGHRYTESHDVVHNAGKDWEDMSSFCPACGNSVESSDEYRMHDGPIPQEAPMYQHPQRRTNDDDTPTMRTVRMARHILEQRGLDPDFVTQDVWAAACEEARNQ